MVDGSYIPILGSVFIHVTKECYSAYHGSGDWYETKTNMKEINISKIPRSIKSYLLKFSC